MSEHKRQMLEHQANTIEAVLAQYGVQARVTGGLVFPRWIQFQVSSDSGNQIGKVKSLSGELAWALNSESCRVSSRQGWGIAVEIPRPDPQPVRLLPLQYKLVQRQELPSGTAVMGLSYEGAPLLARLPAPQVGHLLISGDAGSGKSALTRSIIASLALRHQRRQLGLVLIASQRNAFGPLAGLPHLLRPVLSQPGDVTKTLQSLAQLIATRCENGHSREPRIVVAIDELAELLALPGTNGQMWGTLAHLAQRGREAGIHLVVCAQKPTDRELETIVGDSFPVRLVGRRALQQGDGNGTELPCRPGDFVAMTGGRAIGFHAAHVSARELAEITCQRLQVEQICQVHTRPNNNGATRKTPRRSASYVAGLYWKLFKHWLKGRKRQGYDR